MRIPRIASPKVLALSGCGVLLLAVTTWGVSAHYRTKPKAPPADPAKLMQEMHRSDLTEEQRHALAQNMRDSMEARIDSQVEEYYSAPPEEKERILDRHIDKMQEEMKQREAEHEREAETHRDDGPTTRPHRGFGSMSPQERKKMSETRNPDQMARRMAYFAAMRTRMTQRGIQGGHFRGPMGHGGGGDRH
jgi:hypothetical protein